MTPGAVLFDVDGTLIDSNYLHTLAWWRALDDAGERRPMSELHKLIGMGGAELLREVLSRTDEAIQEGHSRHYQRLKGELTPLPGARQVLERTKKAGLRVVLATSAQPRDLGDLLRVLDCDELIDDLVDAGDVEEAKPAGDLFVSALAKAGCAPSQALAVGDTPWDIQAAGRAGVDCVAVMTGGHSGHDLTQAGAVAVYRHTAELAAAWADSPLGGLSGRRGGTGEKRVCSRSEETR